jgi:hypothetical protein
MLERSTAFTRGLPPYDDLPETVQAAFRGRTMLSMPELATLLEMSVPTLRAHVANGDISGRSKGVGKIHPRICFTIADVAKYFRTPRNTLYFLPPDYPGEVRTTSFKWGTMNVQLPGTRRKKRKSLPTSSKGAD